MKSFLSLLRAEHVEHRGGQLWTPVMVGLLLILLIVIGIFHNGSMVMSVELDDSSGVNIQTMDDIDAAIRSRVTEEDKVPVMQAVAFGTTYFTMLPPLGIALVVSYFLMIGSMHNERVDRSILFWKSMPVSDLKVTISKFLAGTFGTLFIATGVGTVIVLVVMLLLAVAGPFNNTPEWYDVAHPAVLASTVAMTIGICIFYVLWALPVYGWIMLASAWAPRSPLLYVVVPPVAVGIVEVMLKQHSFLWSEIGRRVSGSHLSTELHIGETAYSTSSLAAHLLEQVGTMAEATLTPRFWVGLAVGGALIWAASEVRRRRIA